MQNQTTNSDDETPTIPDELIIENILARLPIKPLVRFKCVSQSWLSTISSLKFAKSQLKFSSPSSQFLLFLYHGNPSRRVVSISTDESGHLKELANLDFTYNSRDIYVVGSCNGLICLHDKHEFCLWNPATRSYHYFDGPDVDERDNIFALGFGYVPSLVDCRIACLLSSKKDAAINVYVFSFRTARWERLTTLYDIGHDVDQGEPAVMINDTLYWSPILIRRRNQHVVGLNMVNGELSKIPLPELAMSFCPRRMKLFKMKGRLSFYWLDLRGGNCVVWMLMRNGSGWLKTYEFYYFQDTNLLYITEDGKSLILKRNSIKLLLLDPSDMHHRKFEGGIQFDDHMYLASPSALEYKESLISPVVSAENAVEIEN